MWIPARFTGDLSNVTTLYGKTDNSRIADPADPQRRIFRWLICESYDDKGNAIVYEYKKEDSANVDLSQVHERNRIDQSRSANRYLKRIKYGNPMPRQPNEDLTDRTDWMFEVLFDYGEGYYPALDSDAEGRQFVQTRPDDDQLDENLMKTPLGRPDQIPSPATGPVSRYAPMASVVAS